MEPKILYFKYEKAERNGSAFRVRAAGKICIELDIHTLFFTSKMKISPLKNRNLLTNAFSQQLQYF